MRRAFRDIHWRREGSGAPPPPWISEIETGTDYGLFGPGSAVWAVNGSLTTMIGGIRALLIQALHPGALAGIHEHSRYREDTMGRLNGTIRWLAVTTFGSREAAISAAQSLRRIHSTVRGEYVDSAGTIRAYSASDPDLASWVHAAFTEAFLGAYRVWHGTPPGGADAYISEWSVAGTLMGVKDAPISEQQLSRVLSAFDTCLCRDERVDDIVRFIRKPALPAAARFVYPLLFGGAVASLPYRYRAALGLRRPIWPAITLNRLLLVGMRIALGPTSPSERVARRRATRIRSEVLPSTRSRRGSSRGAE